MQQNLASGQEILSYRTEKRDNDSLVTTDNIAINVRHVLFSHLHYFSIAILVSVLKHIMTSAFVDNQIMWLIS